MTAAKDRLLGHTGVKIKDEDYGGCNPKFQIDSKADDRHYLKLYTIKLVMY